ncbi:phospholipase/carboxylesterase [Enterococcus moraviensis ATCC BAA-383]|uniref:Phospholipase/carboxylesterase n=1 Tax=Enterococcus moraviensis ATCC BAA-383 TaxID=1158609 RepID=R2QZ14_9ENTE|nr:alpha/beta hydrolase [Enterococcus moraviensis]EOI01805.1 phospholipase/carboxylesterase [Enterococcus moraviensis ATCC BAA-383]EOT73660.1 phospholipase/carboxylesterase [Enterococcus moraviensis ATCC BAA-383]OJG69220.1 phospholipase/carboxylesterase [Enterococcus moraviensis]
MKYLFEQGKPQGKKLLLLHGTGGDETSLLDIARFLDEEATLLSFRGTVQESGMNRFFKRNGLNQFDLVSLEEESDRLIQMITTVSEEKSIPIEEWVIVGYSNGANIAAHLLLERHFAIKQAILLHPMSLGVDTQEFPLSDKAVWLSVSENDPIVSREASNQLIEQLKNRHVSVTISATNSGHQITMDEINQAKKWLSER